MVPNGCVANLFILFYHNLGVTQYIPIKGLFMAVLTIICLHRTCMLLLRMSLTVNTLCGKQMEKTVP